MQYCQYTPISLHDLERQKSEQHFCRSEYFYFLLCLTAIVSYPNIWRTLCGIWFACASIDCTACWRILNLVKITLWCKNKYISWYIIGLQLSVLNYVILKTLSVDWEIHRQTYEEINKDWVTSFLLHLSRRYD